MRCSARARQGPLLAVVGVTGLLAVGGHPAAARAAEWTVTPEARIAQSWTDNIALSADNAESEWITEVSPGVRVRGEGGRTDVDLRYRLRNFAFAREPDRNRSDNEIGGRGTVELVNDRLFLDGEGSRAREISSPDGVVPGGGVFAGGREDRTAWSVGPRWQYEVGRFAGARASYRRQRVESGVAGGETTDADTTRLGLTSGPVFRDWGWAVDYSRRDESVDRDSGDLRREDTVLSSVRGEVSRRVTAATQLFVAGGREDNEFDEDIVGEPIDGEFWEAGVRWNPRRSVAVEAAAGERFFGDTARLSVRANGPALSLDLGLNEDIVTTSQVREGVILSDLDGTPLPEAGDGAGSDNDGFATIDNDVIQQRRARARLGWARSHTDIGLTVTATERDFLIDGTSEDARRAGLDASWSRLARTTLLAGLGYSMQEFADTDREDDTRSLRLGARRELGGDADLLLDYELFERDSTARGSDYTVNRITLALEARF